MISKQTFVMLMHAIQEQDKKDRDNGRLITKMGDPEFNNHGFIFTTPLVAVLINALEIEMKDVGNMSNISYWIYELDYGRKSDEMKVTRKDGSVVPMYTSHQLYDWLIECQ